MKTFDQIYDELQNGNSELNELYQEAKKEREKSKKISGIICLIVDILFLIYILINGLSSITTFYMLIFVFFINVAIWAVVNIIFSKNQNIYNKKYKEIVINKLMNNFYDNLEYFPYKEMPKYIYDEAFYDFYDKYSSEDYFEAQINNQHSIQMAEVLTEKIEEYKDSKGETRTREITLFHGLFAKIVMHKSIMQKFRITQNNLWKSRNRIELDSSEFEKYFDVETTDKILGMRILTADVMEELVQFEKKTNMKYEVYIKENELYLRFHSGEMFEATDLKKEKIEQYFYMLNFTYNLANKIIKIVDEIEI